MLYNLFATKVTCANTVVYRGCFTVSATHPSLVLVPPLCALTVAGDAPEAPTAEATTEAPTEDAPSPEEKKGCAAAGASAALLPPLLALPLLKKKEQ